MIKHSICVAASVLCLTACNKGPTVDLKNADTNQVSKAVTQSGVMTSDSMVQPGLWESKVTVQEMTIPGMPPQYAAKMKQEMAEHRNEGSKHCIKPEDVKKPKEDFFGADKSCRYGHFTMRGGGAVSADPRIGDRVAEALERAGINAEVELVGAGEIGQRCRASAERGDPLVVVGGGDGTISAAASALAGTETLLGILPLGTLNHFGRDLGIPTDLDEAAALIAARTVREVDVAEMNDRTFINNSAIGLYPLLVLDRDSQP